MGLAPFDSQRGPVLRLRLCAKFSQSDTGWVDSFEEARGEHPPVVWDHAVRTYGPGLPREFRLLFDLSDHALVQGQFVVMVGPNVIQYISLHGEFFAHDSPSRFRGRFEKCFRPEQSAKELAHAVAVRFRE